MLRRAPTRPVWSKVACHFLLSHIDSVAPPKNKLLEGPILRSLLTLAIPIVAANVLQSAYQIIDAFWVGRLGGAAVAAVSVSFPVMFLMFAVGAGLSMAGSTLIAQYVGARNERMVGHVAGQTMLMVVLASLVLGTIGLFRRAGAAAADGRGARRLSRRARLHARVVHRPGVQLHLLRLQVDHARASAGRTCRSISSLGTVFLNFVLDPLLIFGWGPVPAYGVMGAAIATLVTPGRSPRSSASSCCGAACTASMSGAPTSSPTSPT